MRRSHIVWDWNGTLLDDLEIVIESVNVGLESHGMPAIDADTYRHHFVRPVRSFYDSLFGRSVGDDEWRTLNETFHREYDRRAREAPLTTDSREALARVSDLGWTQSLLSMSAGDFLGEIVGHHQLASWFTRVDGVSWPDGGHKAVHLKTHLDSLSIDAGMVVVIGDTPDDAVAASEAGSTAVLYDGGSHHIERLMSHGVPVASTLLEAVDLAAGRASAEPVK
ncbi:MAG: HAD hydrolase-like protein [Acidimicrobiia bacterium]